MFVKPHPDYGMESLEDRIGINASATRMAVADGMTLSYLSGPFAEAIVHKFISDDTSLETLKNGSAFTSNDVAEAWSRKVEEIELQSKGTDAGWLLQNRKKQTPHGDCTLVGIDMTQQDSVTAIAIGDCCIFFLSEEGRLLKAIPNIKVGQFGNAPDYISSTGSIYGKICTEQISSVSGGYIVLMSDAVAEWFLKHLDEKPSSLEKIWQLKNQEEMYDFFNNEYFRRRIKGDDIAIIIVRMGSSPVAQSLPFFPRYEHLAKHLRRERLKHGVPKARGRRILSKTKLTKI